MKQQNLLTLCLLPLIIGLLTACQPIQPTSSGANGGAVTPPAVVDGTNAALTGIITGTVAYLQRIALPPGSVINIELQDISIADAPAKILASQTITTAGENVPIPFELTYDPAKIDPRFRYSVRATIHIDGNLRWTSTQANSVLTNDAPLSNIEVIVEPVG